MNLTTIMTHALRTAKRALLSNAPAALKAAGVASGATAVVLLCRASYNTRGLIDNREFYWETATVEEKRETCSDILKLYLPGVIVGAGAIACFVGAGHIERKRMLALESAYMLLNESANTYQRKVIERLGEDAHREILSESAEDISESERAALSAPASLAVDGHGDTLCYDRVTGRKFYSSVQAIREAESEIVKRLTMETFVSLNQFYEALGIPDYSFVGDAIGWDVNDFIPDIVFRTMLDDNDHPMLVLNYSTTMINEHNLRAM